MESATKDKIKDLEEYVEHADESAAPLDAFSRNASL